MDPNRAPRRRHSVELKAKVLAACNEPGASIAAVALAHGLNANLVRKWRVGRGVKPASIAAPVVVEAVAAAPLTPAPQPLLATTARFVPIELSPPAQAARAEPASRANTARAVPEPIHVELRRGGLHLSVRWPTSAAVDCTAWLRELTSGLLK